MIVEQLKSYLGQINFDFDLNELPKSAYLVGGSVRDALLQRYKHPLDLDFVLPQNAIAIAKKIANQHQAGFVVLDVEREIARVVFPQGTLDLARQEGNDLETDLHRRDFTINAIAYNLQSQRLVDPLGGVEDLQRKILRMVSTKNLEDDPLRLLRAYRQAAQLNFAIDPQTREAIAKRASLLKTVAAERVQAELNYLFTASQGNRWLRVASIDGLLQQWLPSVNSEKVEQLERVTKAAEYCGKLGLHLPAMDLPALTILAKLCTLVASEAAIAEAELTNLKYSRAQIKAITKTLQHLPQLHQLQAEMSLRSQYLWFLEVKDCFPLLMVQAIATGVSPAITDTLIERYLDPNDPVVYPQPLITGNDLISELNLKPSPQIGTLLTEVQIAQIESRIATRQQALDFAHSWLVSGTEAAAP